MESPRIAKPAAKPYCPSSMKTLLTLLWCALPLVAAAEIYRYVDDDGNVHYTDEPPAQYKDTAKPVDLEPLRTVDLPSVSGVQSAGASQTGRSAGQGGAAAYSNVTIARPLNEQTIRDASNTLTVVVQTQPSLRTDLGHGLRFLLNGEPVNSEPVAANSLTLREVYRGSHTISAEVVAGNGQVIGRATPVTVFMKPPRAR